MKNIAWGMGNSKTYSETPRDWIQFSVYDKLILSPVLLLASFAFLHPHLEKDVSFDLPSAE